MSDLSAEANQFAENQVAFIFQAANVDIRIAVAEFDRERPIDRFLAVRLAALERYFGVIRAADIAGEFACQLKPVAAWALHICKRQLQRVIQSAHGIARGDRIHRGTLIRAVDRHDARVHAGRRKRAAQTRELLR